MKSRFAMTLLAGLLGTLGSSAQYAFVTGPQSTPVLQPIPPAATTAPISATMVSAPPGDYALPPCYQTPAIYHVPSPNVIYFGRPESHLRNYLNRGYYYRPSTVVYFGRGESWQRGYRFYTPR